MWPNPRPHSWALSTQTARQVGLRLMESEYAEKWFLQGAALFTEKRGRGWTSVSGHYQITLEAKSRILGALFLPHV